jgi:cell division GTPase FtsZ
MAAMVAVMAAAMAAWAGMGGQAGRGAAPVRRQCCHASGVAVTFWGGAVAAGRAAAVVATAR